MNSECWCTRLHDLSQTLPNHWINAYKYNYNHQKKFKMNPDIPLQPLPDASRTLASSSCRRPNAAFLAVSQKLSEHLPSSITSFVPRSPPCFVSQPLLLDLTRSRRELWSPPNTSSSAKRPAGSFSFCSKAARPQSLSSFVWLHKKRRISSCAKISLSAILFYDWIPQCLVGCISSDMSNTDISNLSLSRTD